jgi:hypothetical protein
VLFFIAINHANRGPFILPLNYETFLSFILRKEYETGELPIIITAKQIAQ